MVIILVVLDDVRPRWNFDIAETSKVSPRLFEVVFYQPILTVGKNNFIILDCFLVCEFCVVLVALLQTMAEFISLFDIADSLDFILGYVHNAEEVRVYEQGHQSCHEDPEFEPSLISKLVGPYDVFRILLHPHFNSQPCQLKTFGAKYFSCPFSILDFFKCDESDTWCLQLL
jgi:hypothetical protein